MRWQGVAAGILMGLLLLGVLWYSGMVGPPERLSRAVATFYAVYPRSTRDAATERIDCPPLRHTRLYVVCTRGCDDVWRVVAVRGLHAEPVSNPGRLPPEPPEVRRERLVTIVKREHLDLGADGARDLIACYLRLEGLFPQLVLTEGNVGEVAAIAGDDEAGRALVDVLAASPATERIEVEELPDGWRSRLYYWETSAAGRPVMEIDLRLRRDGVLQSATTRPLAVTGDTASDSTPDIPPS